MINLIDGWAIDANDFGYTLGVPVTSMDKHGAEKTTMTKATYHSNLDSAVRALYRRYMRKEVQTGTYTLETAIKALDVLQQRFETILYQAVGRLDELKKEAPDDMR